MFEGLFGSSSVPSMSDWTSGMGIDTSALTSAEQAGLSNSYWNLYDTNGFANQQGLLGSNGNFDLSSGSIGNYINNSLDWLGDNKDSINALGGLFNTYSNYQSLQNQQDIAKQQLALQQDYYANLEAERQRQIGLQEEATSGMQTGLGLSALNTNKKSKTNYYSV